MDFLCLTQNTEKLIQEIRSPPTVIGRMFGQSDRRTLLIEKVAGSGEIAAIPFMLGLLFDETPGIAEAASDCLHRLTSIIPPKNLPEFGEQLRTSAYWSVSDHWRRLHFEDVPSLSKTDTSRTSIFGLASLHQNGYVREAAVHELAEHKDGSELPFLLLRLNDWVANVRAAAKVAVQERMVPSRFDQFLKNIVLVLRLTECSRQDHGDVVQWLIRRLVDSEHVPVLRELLTDPDQAVRRKCFQLAHDLEGTHRSWLVTAGFQSDDVVIRLRAAQSVRRQDGEADLHNSLMVMDRDSFMPIRREALLTKVERQLESSLSSLEGALMDRSASMRELARFYLSKLGEQNYAAVYRQALASGRDNVTALMGLGETGTKADLPLILPFLKSTLNRERVAAVRALGNCGGDEVVTDLTCMLVDDCRKVVRAAKEALSSNAGSLDAKLLWAILSSDFRTHVQFAVLDLLSQTGSWTGLPYLVRAASHSDDGLASRARELVHERFNHVFTKPTATDLEQIHGAVNEVGVRLDIPFRNEFNEWLRSRT